MPKFMDAIFGPAPQQRGGLMDVVFDKFDTWKDSQHTEAELARIENATKVTKARSVHERTVMQANIMREQLELQGRKHLARLAFDAEVAEEQLGITRILRTLPGHVIDEVLPALIQRQQQLNALTEAWMPERAPKRELPAATVSAPALEPNYDSQEIERIATRAVHVLAQAPSEESDQKWADFERDIKQRLPDYVAAAVINRTRELRGGG